MAQGAVGQICHPRAPDGSDVQFQQLPVNFKGGHVAVGRRQRRAPAHRRTVFLSARQGSLLFEATAQPTPPQPLKSELYFTQSSCTRSQQNFTLKELH